MTRAVCSGSFDPVTYGHLDIIERASRMFDEIVVAVFHNIRKAPFFTVEERVDMIRKATAHIGNLAVDSFEGLLPEYLHQIGAKVIVRGLRSVTDFEYELQQAQMLKHVAPDIDTIFMLTKQDYYFVSSSGIRELAMFNGDIAGLVPPCVESAIKRRIADLKAKS